jgi:hypothetical protein
MYAFIAIIRAKIVNGLIVGVVKATGRAVPS